ncbi:calpain-2 catalytic subunit-like isoform X2 [Zerene cesonia]|uniref:calpain-2 catalytic subunit-like isoform X2 n=1 Tax=Zerene cesonia TaxID=33412 RepID=UPI0018E58D48|nr:calpain-2 catalytic subunit-like isoform X2 [Zerene cesonia]
MKKFMRTRAPPALPAPPAHPAHPAHSTGAHASTTLGPPLKTNGIGNGATRREETSPMSRYWGESEQSAGSAGALWEDPEGGALARLPHERRFAPHAAAALWLRPHELCARPRFLGDTAIDADLAPDQLDPEPEDQFAARWSVEVGEVGDGGLCAAAAALALTPQLLARVAPPHSFRTNYTGKFRFRFWVFGEWREVCVDDRLPVRGGRLLASRAALRDDFTLPLLEKAYAKLHGSYAALRAARGGVARALQELSGGVVQSFAPPRQPRALLFQVLNSAVPRSTLLVATAMEKESSGRRLRNGLIAGQAYCVTGLARVREEGGAAGAGAEGPGGALVRLRAPSGRGEWAGAWARGGPQWRALADADRDLLERRAAQPGHFWMSFVDFARAFSRLELVHVGPDDWLGEPALHGKRAWRAVLARRRWRVGYNAGGPPSAPTAHANPQFHVQVPRAEGKCHVVVSVTQQYAVGARRSRLHAIGFAVYELPPSSPPRRPAPFSDLRALDVTHCCAAREVATFFTLPAGQYLVVPHTRRPHTAAAFLLRILTDHHTDVWEVNDDNAIIRDIAAEFEQEGWPVPPDMQAIVNKLMKKQETEEVEGEALRAALRGAWRRVLPAPPSLELCRALLTLRDPAVSGRVPAHRLPPLLALLAFWKQGVEAASGGARRGCGARRVSAYRLRALLWACGLSASNKVLECLVLRFARGAALSPAACLLALARLHLAHERYRSLDAKLKSNPLSLEEMILMTIYS